MRGIAIIIGTVAVSAACTTSWAGAVVDLVPENPGPYLGGESMTVDFWVDSDLSYDVDLRTIVFDFSDTDPALSMDATFAFDFTSMTSGLVYTVHPDLPLPSASFLPDILYPPGLLLVLPGGGSLHIGSIGLELPNDPGIYRLDALNADEPDLFVGGALFDLAHGPLWRAFTGELSGGALDLTVIPEPMTLGLLALGGLVILCQAPARNTRMRRTSMYMKLIVTLGVLGLTSVAKAGAVVELVPDRAGPYYGGESMTVDFWLHSDLSYDVDLRTIVFDFSDTDPALSTDPTFEFDFSSMTSGLEYTVHPDLPLPSASFLPDVWFPPGLLLVLPGEDSLHIGNIGVELPTDPGIYRFDALNADEPDLFVGGALFGLRAGVLWRGFTGEIKGGTFDFTVIPEPMTLSLLGLGALALLTIRRRRLGGAFTVSVCLLVGISGPGSMASAQPVTIPAEKVPVNVDSGVVGSPTAAASDPVVVFSHPVSAGGAAWVRLHFADVQLGSSQGQGKTSFVRITSLEDRAVQVLDAISLRKWGNSTAYFNGDTVLVELAASPGTGDHRIVVDSVSAGTRIALTGGLRLEGSMECNVDDRVASDDPRVGRFLFFDVALNTPSLCSAFLFNERSNCLLTAGHCCDSIDFESEEFPPLVEFNVPLSDPDGSLNHPAPEDQYPVDPVSIQFQAEQVGDDWCYFGSFDNTSTGLSPRNAQGASYRLAESVPAPDLFHPSTLRITGYGDDAGQFKCTEQTDTGRYQFLGQMGGTGLAMGYSVFTTEGLSGAPVVHLCRDLVYGIHTNGGCTQAPYYRNHGTAIDHPNLQSALANPQGVCAEPQDCNGNGIDDVCDIACGPPGGDCDVPGCGQSQDCTSDGTPDECEPDCNSSGVADSCDIDSGLSDDLNDNGVPDECEPDLFVDANAPPGGDGLSWETAYNDLQDTALGYDPCNRGVKRIWVAAGTYKPDRGTGNRSSSFQNSGGVPAALYGGFVGGETSLNQREPAANPTILSGDIGVPGDNSDNSYHVLRNLITAVPLVLDGFIVTGGNANHATQSDKRIAGALYDVGAPTIRNCVFIGNSAADKAGAIFAGGNATLVNCVFTGNSAGIWGGAVYSENGGPDVRNCTFSANSAGLSGAAVATYRGSPIIRNSIFWGNTPDQISGTAFVYYSDVQGGWLGSGGNNINENPDFVDADGPDNVPGTADDDFRLLPGSPCMDAGDNTAVPPGVFLDLYGHYRFADYPGAPDTGNGTPPIVDMGVHEFQCGGVECPGGIISGSYPANRTLDARQPYEPNAALPRQGIGSAQRPEDHVYMILNPLVGGAEHPCCWGLCETKKYSEGPNRITGATKIADGVYEIHLERAITAGAVTTIEYVAGTGFVEYIAHPANVDGDSASGPVDIMQIINCLNHPPPPSVYCPWGIYSCDADHSNVCGPADILRVIDLLNGADEFDPWLGVQLPQNNSCPPGEGFAGAGGTIPESGTTPSETTAALAEDTEQFINGFVSYLATSKPLDSAADAEFKLVVEALTGFCVQNLSPDERAKLAERLQDPSLTFASETAATMVPEIVAALLK